MPEMDAPRALVFRPLVKGNEALGTRLRADQKRRSLRVRESWKESNLSRVLSGKAFRLEPECESVSDFAVQN